MSRLTDLIAQVKAKDPEIGAELEVEYKALSRRKAFGLNFERHKPESIEMPGRPIRRGDKVRVLPERGTTGRGDQQIWTVLRTEGRGESRKAHLLSNDDEETTRTVAVHDLVAVADSGDPIYPGLVETGRVERGTTDDPFHTVINGENLHALKLLSYTHRGKVDAIYIDPPYNTGDKDWKYNNDYVEEDDLYRHSKWLAFMERRLLLAKELLNPDDSVLIVTIDEKEYLRLGLLLEQTFSAAAIQMVSTQINPAAVARAGQFGRQDEYVYFVALGNAAPQRVALRREWASSRGRTHTGKIRWDLLRRSGTNAHRAHSPGCFYPIYIDPDGPRVASVGEPLPEGVSKAPDLDGLVAVLPIRQDRSEGNWQWAPDTFKRRMKQGRVRISGSKSKGFVVSILKPGEYSKIEEGFFKVTGRGPDGSLLVEQADSEADRVMVVPGTQWRIPSHDATQYGSRLLSGILGKRSFPFPKSLYAVEDALRFFVSNKPNATVLDFFAGSGTTAHAVMRLNHQDGGRRRSISVTNNEVGASEATELRRDGYRPGDPEWESLGICDHVTKPRIEAAITGRTPDGDPIKGDYKFTDEFPMADGFQANARFFTLTYETPIAISHNRAFSRIAPLLWLRAGAQGKEISAIPEQGWEIADTYAVLDDLDTTRDFLDALGDGAGIRIAYIVTDDASVFESVSQQLPDHIEPVRLYQSYLTNLAFLSGD